MSTSIQEDCVPVSTGCQDWTFSFPNEIAIADPVGETSAEAPATAFLNPTSSPCPVKSTKVFASKTAVP